MLRGGASDTACGGSALLDTEGRISIWAHKGIRERIDKAGLYGSAQAWPGNSSHEQLFASCQSEQIKDWFGDIALSASGIGTVQAAISLRDEDGRNDLEAVNVPTVIIHGKKDVVVSSQLVEYQHMEITGSRLFQLENSGHGIVYDELERFNDLFLLAVEGEE